MIIPLFGRREKTPTPKTEFNLSTLLSTPGRFTTRPLPVHFTTKLSVVSRFPSLVRTKLALVKRAVFLVRLKSWGWGSFPPFQIVSFKLDIKRHNTSWIIIEHHKTFEDIERHLMTDFCHPLFAVPFGACHVKYVVTLSAFFKHAFRQVTCGFWKGIVPGAPPLPSPGPLRMPKDNSKERSWYPGPKAHLYEELSDPFHRDLRQYSCYTPYSRIV